MDWVEVAPLENRAWERKITAEGDPRDGHNTSLNNSVLLSSKGLLQESGVVQKLGPTGGEEEAQEPRRDI